MSKRKKLAIIDGKSVFYRGYYAMPNLSTKDGTPTGGVYGFAAMSLELIKKLKPDYVAVAWDKPKTNIRSRLAIYPGYKAGRKPAPADFYAQIPILHDLLRTFNWPLYELDDYEADDIMASLAKQAEAAGIETMLISSDMDMLQAVGEHTHMYALKKGFSNIERFDIEAFENKYGIKVEQFLDLKSLKGDSSDNIPGVPGIGEKTAIQLLQDYETLDGVYENLGLLKDSLRLKLEAGKDSARMSREVARLYDDAPIPLDLEAMDAHDLDVHALKSLLTSLEFRSLLRNLPDYMVVKDDGKSKVESIKLKVGDIEPLKTIIIDSEDKLNDVKLEASEVVIHTFAKGAHGRDPQVLIVADTKTAYVLDIPKLSKKALHSTLSTLQSVVGYDVKSSLKVLIDLGLDTLPKVSHDVLVGAFLINSIRREHTLTELAFSDLGYESSSLDDLSPEDMTSRAGELVAVIRALHNFQSESMSELTKMIQLAEQVEWPVIPVLARMEYAGIGLDTTYLNKMGALLADKISDIEQTIYGYADQEFNISSPSQLSEILFEKLKLPTSSAQLRSLHVDGGQGDAEKRTEPYQEYGDGASETSTQQSAASSATAASTAGRQGGAVQAWTVKKGKAGHYSTASDVLNKLRDLHPIIADIELYREYTKLKNTYVDALPKLVDSEGRVHTTFNLTTAATGRLSSVDPNLQNIPVRTDLGKKIRTAFVARPGHVFVSADYSQFELRLAAALSDDKDMIAAFNNDQDIHALTAAAVMNLKPEEVTKDMRYAAKAVNFGIMYGQGPHGLAEQTGMSFAEARDFIDKYFMIRPKLKQYIEHLREMALKKGYVETVLGRRRPTPDVQSSNFMVRESAYRQAINMPIQGSAADLTKLAMVRVQEKLPKGSEMLLQIHDSILIEVPEKDAESVSKMLVEVMENVYPDLGVKIKADVSTGKNWGEL